MLDINNAGLTVQDLWDQLSSITTLPEGFTVFDGRAGAAPVHRNCHRRCRRFYLRTKGILLAQDGRHGVYVKDLSRQGIGFLAPLQLFPREEVELLIPGKPRLQLSVTRCRRLGAECYECGTVIQLAEPPVA